MARLTMVLIVAIVTALLAGVHCSGQPEDRSIIFQTISLDELLASICKININSFWVDFCNSFSTTTSTSTTTTTRTTTTTTDDVDYPTTTTIDNLGDSTTTTTDDLDDSTTTTIDNLGDSTTTTIDDLDDSTTTTTVHTSTVVSESSSAPGPGSTLERAHWCPLNNGSYLSLDYTFMYTECLLCKCLSTRAIRCTALQCMPTYCVDDSTPIQRPGQCCQQCSYDNQSTACIINGVSFPHGTVLRRSGDVIQCWCQMGSVECRRGSDSLFSSLDLWGEGTAVYVIIAFVGIVLIVGTLLCGACTLFFYYYYQRTQKSAQQAYEDYYNNAGWHPVGEDTEIIDDSAVEKQAEAEQNQFEQIYTTENSKTYPPPSYPHSNDSRPNEANEKDQHF